MEVNEKILDRLRKLEEKYSAMGQDMASYLDGLLYSEGITYWDYIRLDVLLNLQKPETPFEDEKIFIIYHQITELYFRLVLNAIDIIADDIHLDTKKYLVQIKRVNSYFAHLISSFEIMVDGMDPDQFLKFRMALLPASGFQSAQYRMIELCSTDVNNLIHHSVRKQLVKSEDLNEKYGYLYWKRGATELATGKKTLTLRQFETKYSDQFIHTIREYYHKNLYQQYLQLIKEGHEDEELKNQLRKYDVQANILWPLAHYKSAVRYLHKDTAEIEATGGTNWQEYLPPKNQLIQFFPDLWSEQEKEDWGRKTDLDGIMKE